MRMCSRGLATAFTLSILFIGLALSGPVIGSAQTPVDKPDSEKPPAVDPSYHVSGMTTMALKGLLTEKLKDFIDSPEVTVILVESHSKNFYIIGTVTQPGTYPLMKDMTVLQAISLAGGLGEWADADSIRIIRKSSGKEKILHFDYKKVISGKNLEQNIVLQPNDTIVVP